jgi:methylisocitrate lyase
MIIPGVFSPFTALLAERAGFSAAYLSGGAFTSSMGIPDIGLVGLTELSTMVRLIKDVSDVELVVDADTGFGSAISVWRTVRVLERSGADAIQIEDQKMPKRCGHLDGKEIIETEEMNQKIRAAVDARRDCAIIARTDARAVEGIGGAIERAREYASNGADIIFPEALVSRDEFKTFSKNVDAPLLANMTEFGKTPLLPSDFFRRNGYRYVIFPVTAFRAAARAAETVYSTLKSDGSQRRVMNKLMTRSQQYDVIHYSEYETKDRTFSIKSRRRK